MRAVEAPLETARLSGELPSPSVQLTSAPSRTLLSLSLSLSLCLSLSRAASVRSFACTRERSLDGMAVFIRKLFRMNAGATRWRRSQARPPPEPKGMSSPALSFAAASSSFHTRPTAELGGRARVSPRRTCCPCAAPSQLADGEGRGTTLSSALRLRVAAGQNHYKTFRMRDATCEAHREHARARHRSRRTGGDNTRRQLSVCYQALAASIASATGLRPGVPSQVRRGVPRGVQR